MRAFAHYVAGYGGDLWGRLTGTEAVINSASMGLGRQFHTFSSARAENELGYTIRPVEETVMDTWQWFRQQGYVTTRTSASDRDRPSSAEATHEARDPVTPANQCVSTNRAHTQS
jgi:dihydroflavonol-4-reductase